MRMKNGAILIEIQILLAKWMKLEFECPEDLDKAIKTEIIILAEGKKEIVLERKRNSKIVRCFNCNRFGHRASSCKSQMEYSVIKNVLH